MGTTAFHFTANAGSSIAEFTVIDQNLTPVGGSLSGLQATGAGPWTINVPAVISDDDSYVVRLYGGIPSTVFNFAASYVRPDGTPVGSVTVADGAVHWFKFRLGNSLTAQLVLVETSYNFGGASAPQSYLVETITQAAHGLSFMNAVHHNGTAWVKSQANAAATVAQAVVVAVLDANSFIVAYAGAVPVTAHGLTVGEYYWLDQGTAGLLTLTQPTSGIVQPVLHVRSANTLLLNIGFGLSI